ncbi:hypothetical protein [uncultured Marinobacter sp.]|uniref:hypothetical protein n=1 Tax=uncultured Marinobacter sp. TaxID=187379 RepID=UPI0030DB2276
MANTATLNAPTTPGRRAPRSQSRNKGVPALKQQADVESNRQQVERWMRLSRKELDAIYLKARPGRLPLGDTRGTALFAGWPGAAVFSRMARAAWQGKVFDLPGSVKDTGVVVNKILPKGWKLIVAKAYQGQSWLDGKPTLVIDYSTTSVVARLIRDEIREVAPGLYLGKVWIGKRRVLDFALEQPDPTQA